MQEDFYKTELFAKFSENEKKLVLNHIGAQKEQQSNIEQLYKGPYEELSAKYGNLEISLEEDLTYIWAFLLEDLR